MIRTKIFLQYLSSMSGPSSANVTTKVPIMMKSGIVLSSEDDIFTFTEEQVKEIQLHHEFPVVVRPGENVTKEARINTASLEIPFTMKVLTQLGTIPTISGTWRSSNNYVHQSLEVTETVTREQCPQEPTTTKLGMCKPYWLYNTSII